MARRALIAASVAIALVGCAVRRSVVGPMLEVRAPEARAAVTVPPADLTKLAVDNSEFAARLLAALAKRQATIVLSPFSISEALAMTFAGARRETASEIATALHLDMPPTRLHAAFNALDESLSTLRELRTANALYGQRGTAFRPAFLSLLARDYGAGMRIVDFEKATEAARRQINTWVSAQTRGKIHELLQPAVLDQLTRLVLVNAIYLNAKWELPFERTGTQPAPFHAPTGTITTPTMHQTGTYGYVQRPGYRVLELPYEGGRLAFDIVLPDGASTAPLLDGRNPLDLLRGLEPTHVQLALPKLKLRTGFDLSDALSVLGMRRAFEAEQADLSGIAGKPGELSIKAVIHQAYLRVDEAGTEAAAATAVVIAATAAQAPPAITFTVDRPFVFLIRDTKTNAILFMGSVAHP